MNIKNGLLLLTSLLALGIATMAFNHKKAEKDIYQIRVYHMKSNEQVAMVDHFLKNAYLPAMHRLGVSSIGVFK
ncbi:MAG: NIPSNAP family containing protein, partial [Saprospiraceae bacterium]|nr:NIPSNAP family containing protein [Saprospiraceae bacterium]